LGAAIDAVAGVLDPYKTVLALAGAALLAISLALSVYMKAAKLESTWYGGRAVAESVKSLSWRYMMGAEPFPIAGDAVEVDRNFVAKLASIVEERKELMFGFGGEATDAPQISAQMRELRLSAFEKRKPHRAARRKCCHRDRSQHRWDRRSPDTSQQD
jgi:hypothetical protein